MMKSEINKLLKKHNIVIQEDPKKLSIKKKFNFFDGRHTVVLMVSLMAISGALYLYYPEEIIIQWFNIVITTCVSLELLVLGLLLFEASDYVIVTAQELTMSKQLVKNCVSITPQSELKLEKVSKPFKYKGKIRGYSWHYTIYLINGNAEHKIFDIVANDKDKEDLDDLGQLLIGKINTIIGAAPR